VTRTARSGDAALAASLAALPAMTTAQLRTEWRRLHGHPPPDRLSPDLLRRGIGYTLQEAALGGLPPAIRRRLAGLSSNPSALMADLSIARSTRLKPGATLLRDWHGETHIVIVCDAGFEHQGRRYTSLSQIARAITGAHWSGPRFFGLHRAARPATGPRGASSGGGELDATAP
jgi:hypothetical protein